MLQPVVEASVADRGLNNINLNGAMRQLARAQGQAGSPGEAQATLKQMVDIFRGKSLKPQVMETIREQAAQVAAEIPAKRLKKEGRAPAES